MQLSMLSRGRGLEREREAGPKQSFHLNTRDLSVLTFPKHLAAASIALGDPRRRSALAEPRLRTEAAVLPLLLSAFFSFLSHHETGPSGELPSCLCIHCSGPRTYGPSLEFLKGTWNLLSPVHTKGFQKRGSQPCCFLCSLVARCIGGQM